MKPGCDLREIGLQVTVVLILWRGKTRTSDGSSTECQGSVSGFPGHVVHIAQVTLPRAYQSSLHLLQSAKADEFTGSILQQQQKFDWLSYEVSS